MEANARHDPLRESGSISTANFDSISPRVRRLAPIALGTACLMGAIAMSHAESAALMHVWQPVKPSLAQVQALATQPAQAESQDTPAAEPPSGMSIEPATEEPVEMPQEDETLQEDEASHPPVDQPSGAAAEQSEPEAPAPGAADAQVPSPEGAETAAPAAELAQPAAPEPAPSQSEANSPAGPEPPSPAETHAPPTPPPTAANPTRESAGAATVAAPVARRQPLDTGPLMTRGNAFLREGDIASARLFFERAAEQGDSAAMLALGRTFDPIELRRLGVLGGIKPDAKRALDWYRAAAQAGDATAEQSLSRLSEWVERTR
jgi:hypothetical protein